MQRDRLYSTSRRSALMLCISAGYFLHVSVNLFRATHGVARTQAVNTAWQHHAPMQDLYHCLTVFSEWGVPYLLHATLCCSLYSYGAVTGCLHYFGGSSLWCLWLQRLPSHCTQLHNTFQHAQAQSSYCGRLVR